MALYQATELNPETMMKGSFKIEYAPYVADHTTAVWVDVGWVDDPSFIEEIQALEGTASNGTKGVINTGVASQKINASFSAWSLDPTKVMALRGGLDTLETNATGDRTIFSGGKSTTTPIMLRFSNRRRDVSTAADVTQYTAITTTGTPIMRQTSFITFKNTITAGLNITGKRDDDVDGAIRFPFAFEAVEDTARAEGKQLFAIEYQVSVI